MLVFFGFLVTFLLPFTVYVNKKSNIYYYYVLYFCGVNKDKIVMKYFFL